MAHTVKHLPVALRTKPLEDTAGSHQSSDLQKCRRCELEAGAIQEERDEYIGCQSSHTEDFESLFNHMISESAFIKLIP